MGDSVKVGKKLDDIEQSGGLAQLAAAVDNEDLRETVNST